MKNDALTGKRRLAQIISILHKHHITKGIDPVKMREIIEDTQARLLLRSAS